MCIKQFCPAFSLSLFEGGVGFNEMCMNVGKLESYGPGSDCAVIFPVCGAEWEKKKLGLKKD